MTLHEACCALAGELGCDPDELVDAWAERAAIREFDGGQPRADAERDALDELRGLPRLIDAPRRGPMRVGAASAIERRERNR